MKRLLLTVSTAALLFAAPAHADDISDLDDLTAAGFDQPDNGNAGMIDGGHRVDGWLTDRGL